MENLVKRDIEEIKLEDLPVSNEQSFVKDYFTEDGSQKIKELADLFGQSECELKKEFGSFKAKKVYKKLNYFIDNRFKLNGDIINLIKTAEKYGFYGVTVYPTALPLAVALLVGSSVKVRALIDYPSGESSFKTIKYSLKQALNDGAEEFLISLSAYEFKNDDNREIFKKVKKLVKKADGNKVSVLLDTAILSRAELEKIINLLWVSGIYSIVLMRSQGELDKNLAIELASFAGDRINVECLCDINCSEVAVSTLLGGVSMLTTEYCQEIVLDFSKKINACDSVDAQPLDKTDKE